MITGVDVFEFWRRLVSEEEAPPEQSTTENGTVQRPRQFFKSEEAVVIWLLLAFWGAFVGYSLYYDLIVDDKLQVNSLSTFVRELRSNSRIIINLIQFVGVWGFLAKLIHHYRN